MAWEVRVSSSKGLPYFFNPETKESTWERPADLSEKAADELLKAASASVSAAHAGQVRASHLLVKHAGSRRPASWKEQNITRSIDEAKEILRGYQAEIAGSAEKFGQLAKLHSDCSSHENNGDLGWFGRGQMQKPFEDAAYGLEVGKMSDIISSDSGVHIVLRTG